MRLGWWLLLTMFVFNPANAAENPQKNTPRRPNVLLILTDDHYARALGSVNPEVKTPALDRLAREGVRMDNAYICFPVCHTARCSILTGRYPSSHRAWQNGTILRHYEVTLGEVFLDAKYQTAAIGKMHRQVEGQTQGIQYVWNEDDYYPILHPDDLQATVTRELPEKDQYLVGVQQRPEKELHSSMITREALKWLHQHAADQQPWFLILSYPIPHSPTAPVARYADMYDPEQVTLPPNVKDYFDSSLPWYQPRHSQRNLTEKEIRLFLARYYGLVSLVDDYIGRVLDLLRERKVLDSTIVMFAGDQGEIAGEHGWVGKHAFFYQAEAKFPLIVRYPRLIPAGKVTTSLVSQVDLMPTLLDLADVPIPIGVQGLSQAPVLTGEKPAVRQTCFGEIHQFNKFIRTANFTLTYYRAQGGELYDLNKDPYELNNVFNDPAYVTQRRKLMHQLLEWCYEKEDMSTPVGYEWAGIENKLRQQLRQKQTVHHPGLSVKPGKY
ncbi:MAG: sulfatase family protein [Planctomycetota bacterium]